MLKILLLVPILFAGQLLPVNNRNLTTSPSTWEYVDEIEDGGIYFIRNCYSDKVIDIPNSNYSNGQDCILYQSNGYGNQRFIVRKNGYHRSDPIWSISPLESPEKTLRIENNGVTENNPLEIQESFDFVSNSEADNFLLLPGSFPNSWKITTGASGYLKSLTTLNYSLSNNTPIVQKVFDSNYSVYFDWYFQKTDSLGVNVENNVFLNGTNDMYFNLRVPISGQYIVETSKATSELDTKLEVCNSNGTILSQNDDGGENYFSKIIYNFNSSTDYLIKLYGYSANDIGDVILKVMPVKSVYINTFYNDIDTREDSIQPYNLLTNNGYYTRHLVNIPKSELLKADPNGRQRLNNEYYMLSAHGAEDGEVALSPNEGLWGYELPDMSDVRLAVWANCYSGKSGNIAEYCANYKNALYSLGFPGLTYVDTSKTFTDYLWFFINDGSTIPNAVSLAASYVYFLYSFSHAFEWGDDTIINPSLYSSSLETSLPQDFTISLADLYGDRLSESSVDAYIEFNIQKSTKTILIGNDKLVFETKSNRITNNYFYIDCKNNKVYNHFYNDSNENNYSSSQPREIFKKLNNFNVKLEDEYCLFIDGQERIIKRMQYSIFEGKYEILNEVFFDVNNNQIFSEQEITNCFLY